MAKNLILAISFGFKLNSNLNLLTVDNGFHTSHGKLIVVSFTEQAASSYSHITGTAEGEGLVGL